MPKALEQKLKKEYGAKSSVPYKIMNKMGVMKGNKETAKGRSYDTAKAKRTKLSNAAGKLMGGLYSK